MMKLPPLPKALVLCTCAVQAAALPVALPDSADFTWIPGSNAIGIGNTATTAAMVQNLAAAITSPTIGNTDLTGWFGGTGQGHSAGSYGSDISILSSNSFSFTSRPRLSGEYVAAGAELPETAYRISLSFDYAGTVPAGQSAPTGTIGYSLWGYNASASTATELIAYTTLNAGTNASQSHLGSVEGTTQLILVWNANPPGGGGSGTVSGITLSYIPYATYVESSVNPVTRNGRAGTALLQQALEKQNPQVSAPGSALAGVLDAVDAGTLTDAGAAAVAGAATAILGMAAHNDLNRQLQSLRNRTTTMGVNQAEVNDNMPYYQIWLNAEGNYDELRSHQTASGYRLSSWGGTVGVDMSLAPTVSVGSSMTAMYGQLDATGSSHASGSLNTYYMSFFARYAPGAWSHTLIVASGLSDISLKRRIGDTEVEGDTNGVGIGLMYEVGHLFALNEDATFCLQPLFNMAWRYTHLQKYAEYGSNLALDIKQQNLSTFTFGLGGRMQAVVGENLYNRSCLLECRALAKLDAGDHRGSASTRLAGLQVGVEGAEAGLFGLEAGAGLIVPLGESDGSLFLDAAVELRSNATHVYGTLGYKRSF